MPVRSFVGEDAGIRIHGLGKRMRAKDIKTAVSFVKGAFASREHPLLAHLVVTRRCNLSCTYCNEFDKVSEPVPLDVMKRRIAHLARLRTAAITCTGGEPLLHPDLEDIISECRRYGIITTTITNGYLLTEKRVRKLNASGLQQLEISIDNVVPDDVSHKSLKVLDKKLRLLRDHAEFAVHINSVLGISDDRTPDAIEVAKRAKQYGFSRSVGIIHDGMGTIKPLSPKQRATYREIGKISRSFEHFLYYRLFQKNLMEGKPNQWKCRAGGRYLYVCEDGLVHWCSQQRGYPAIPIEDYTMEDIRREYRTQKNCSPNCTVNCVQAMSMFDRWRGKQDISDPRSALPVLNAEIAQAQRGQRSAGVHR